MSDLISREAAIDLIDEYMDKCIELHYLPTGEGIKTLIFALPSAQQWIPVSERLPDEDRNVLVSVHFLGLEIKHKTGWNDHIKESWYVDIACQIGGEWSSASDEYKVVKNRHIVTAWMPLPDPWKGEEDET